VIIVYISFINRIGSNYSIFYCHYHSINH